MKNNIFTIFKKEMYRFISDKRLFFTTVLLPGLMIYVIYNFIGNTMAKQFGVSDTYIPVVNVKNMPEELKTSFSEIGVSVTDIKDEDIETEKALIEDKKADAAVIFPDDYSKAVAAYDVKSGEEAPNVEIYYDSSETSSLKTYRSIIDMLDAYETSISNKFDINRSTDIKYDLAGSDNMASKIFGSMFPMLLMSFMWGGCIAVAPESISGEKERGTIATLLVTPVKRSSLALGKILAVSSIALMSGVSSFIGVYFSLPAMLGGTTGGINVDIYGPDSLFALFAIIITTILLLVSIVSVISAFAKSVKEANTIVSPFMIIIMLISFLPMILGQKEGTPDFMYAIPLYGSVLCMNDIFTFSYTASHIVITAATTLIASGVLAALLARMFSSEKVMFSK